MDDIYRAEAIHSNNVVSVKEGTTKDEVILWAKEQVVSPYVQQVRVYKLTPIATVTPPMPVEQPAPTTATEDLADPRD